jgi:hypothetical protein
VDEKDRGKKACLFYTSQIALFIYLGLDERFMFHERIGIFLGINDVLILLLCGIVEIGLLAYLGDLEKRPKRVQQYLYLGAMFFAGMAFIDAFLPDRMILRLSFEDLSKIWGIVFLFMFAFEILCNQITELKQRAQVGVDAQRK